MENHCCVEGTYFYLNLKCHQLLVKHFNLPWVVGFQVDNCLVGEILMLLFQTGFDKIILILFLNKCSNYCITYRECVFPKNNLCSKREQLPHFCFPFVKTALILTTVLSGSNKVYNMFIKKSSAELLIIVLKNVF